MLWVTGVESEGFVKCPKCNTVVELLAAHEQSAAEQQENLMNSMATGRGLDGARVSKVQQHAQPVLLCTGGAVARGGAQVPVPHL